MNKKNWYTLWGVLYIVCAALGFVSGVDGLLKAVLILLGLAFFLPPAMLLYRESKTGGKKDTKRIRNLSLLSLGATLILMILNILWAMEGSEALGNVLYAVLVLASSPMYCLQNGLLSMFLWACLLMVAIRQLRNRKK